MRVYLPKRFATAEAWRRLWQTASQMIFYFTSRVIFTRVWSTKFLES
jgi:hypothetical protein